MLTLLVDEKHLMASVDDKSTVRSEFTTVPIYGSGHGGPNYNSIVQIICAML